MREGQSLCVWTYPRYETYSFSYPFFAHSLSVYMAKRKRSRPSTTTSTSTSTASSISTSSGSIDSGPDLDIHTSHSSGQTSESEFEFSLAAVGRFFRNEAQYSTINGQEDLAAQGLANEPNDDDDDDDDETDAVTDTGDVELTGQSNSRSNSQSNSHSNRVMNNRAGVGVNSSNDSSSSITNEENPIENGQTLDAFLSRPQLQLYTAHKHFVLFSIVGILIVVNWLYFQDALRPGSAGSKGKYNNILY